MRKQNNGRFVLRVKGTKRPAFYLEFAGSHDNGTGECEPYARTTRFYDRAMGFDTFKQAERMRQLLNVKYGMKTNIERRV